MSCDRHFLGFHWERHDWVRRVSATDTHSSRQSDMWGRRIFPEDVTCHVDYVCRSCGKHRDGGECGCDKDRAERCATRLAFVEKATERPST